MTTEPKLSASTLPDASSPDVPDSFASLTPRIDSRPWFYWTISPASVASLEVPPVVAVILRLFWVFLPTSFPSIWRLPGPWRNMYAFPSVCVPRPHPSVHSIGATAAQLRTKAPAPPPPSAHVAPFAVILVTVMCCLVAAERLRFPLGGIDDGVSPTPQHDEPSATTTHINTDRSFPRDVCGGFDGPPKRDREPSSVDGGGMPAHDFIDDHLHFRMGCVLGVAGSVFTLISVQRLMATCRESITGCSTASSSAPRFVSMRVSAMYSKS